MAHFILLAMGHVLNPLRKGLVCVVESPYKVERSHKYVYIPGVYFQGVRDTPPSDNLTHLKLLSSEAFRA